MRDSDIYLIEHSLQEHMRQQVVVRPFLGSGGKLAFLTASIGIKGHWEVTADALQRLGEEKEDGFANFTDDAIALIQDAGQDPDFYEWNNPSAHAQTGNDEKTSRSLPGPWQTSWVEWTRGWLGHSLAAAQAGRTADALYYLGYALHSVEDLAAHRGRTNAEHSYNSSFEDKNPDEDEKSILHAATLAYQMLHQAREVFGPT